MVTETVDQNSGQNNAEDHAAEAQVLAFDRRRAGRQDVNPVLVPLLRDPATGAAGLDQTVSPETAYRDYLGTDPFHDPLAPARGIALGLSISMLFWGALGYIIFR